MSKEWSAKQAFMDTMTAAEAETREAMAIAARSGGTEFVLGQLLSALTSLGNAKRDMTAGAAWAEAKNVAATNDQTAGR